MSRKIFALSGAVLLAASIAPFGPAAADDYEGTQADQEACTSDVFRLCENDIPNVDAIVACLNARQSQLSPPCARVFRPAAQARARRKLHRESRQQQ